MNIVKNNNKISTKIKLQNNTDVISRNGNKGNKYVHYVGFVYLHQFTCLFIDCIELYIYISWTIKHLISSDWWPSGESGGLEFLRPCGVGGSNPTVDKIVYNAYLFRVPRSWIGTVQMKSSMTFIPGNRCIERVKDNFKSREVKRLKECALALTSVITCKCN